MIRIITDSTACITSDEAKKYNIDIVSLYVVLQDNNYKDGVDLEVDEFYRLLKENQPTTSQPTPNDFIEVFSKYPEDEIICITLSDKLSGTYQSAVLAQNILNTHRIKVINSNNIALGLRNIVLEAVRLRDAGRSSLEILEKIECMKDKVLMFGVVDTLDNLKRGGRISHLKFFAGKLFHVKPILELKDGILVNSGKKVRGITKGIEQLSKLVIENHYDPSYPIHIGYSYSNENAQLLYKKLKEMNVYQQEEFYHEIGSVIATHTGENAIVISFVSR